MPQASEIDQGVIGHEKTIKRIVDSVGTDKTCTLYLPHYPQNGDNTYYKFLTTETLPSNIFISPEPGALIFLYRRPFFQSLPKPINHFYSKARLVESYFRKS